MKTMTVPRTLSAGDRKFDAEVWNTSDCREAAAGAFDVTAVRGNWPVRESALVQSRTCAE